MVRTVTETGTQKHPARSPGQRRHPTGNGEPGKLRRERQGTEPAMVVHAWEAEAGGDQAEVQPGQGSKIVSR